MDVTIADKSKLACTNPECTAYGKYALPLEAKFCPKCGVSIINDNHKQREMVGNTIVESFFPMYGVILGKTKLGDVEERYVHAGEKMTIYSPYNQSTRFFILPENNCFSAVCGFDIPPSLREFGFEMEHKSDEIREILRNLNLVIQDNGHYHDWCSVMNCREEVILATSQDRRYLIVVMCRQDEFFFFIELSQNGQFPIDRMFREVLQIFINS